MDLDVQPATPPSSAPPRRVPIVQGLPVVGVLHEFLRDPHDTFTRFARMHDGEVFALRLGPSTVYVVTHPDHVYQVFHTTETFVKGGALYDAIRKLNGN